ncbi:MAG: contractile injection system tape measure protein [Gammaproteobacteria bacterium]
MQTIDRSHALGDFIRAHRERLTPPHTSRARRRTPGWRREELSEAAGVSVTWLTWLEQGRQVAPSAGALARLAEALRLSPAERASLFELAGRHDPHAPDDSASALPAELLALPARFAGPAYVLDHVWTARAWTADAAALFPGWLDAASSERNLLRFVFLNPAAQSLIADWHERARRLVADLPEYQLRAILRLSAPSQAHARLALIAELRAIVRRGHWPEVTEEQLVQMCWQHILAVSVARPVVAIAIAALRARIVASLPRAGKPRQLTARAHVPTPGLRDLPERRARAALLRLVEAVGARRPERTTSAPTPMSAPPWRDEGIDATAPWTLARREQLARAVIGECATLRHLVAAALVGGSLRALARQWHALLHGCAPLIRQALRQYARTPTVRQAMAAGLPDRVLADIVTLVRPALARLMTMALANAGPFAQALGSHWKRSLWETVLACAVEPGTEGDFGRQLLDEVSGADGARHVALMHAWLVALQGRGTSDDYATLAPEPAVLRAEVARASTPQAALLRQCAPSVPGHGVALAPKPVPARSAIRPASKPEPIPEPIPELNDDLQITIGNAGLVLAAPYLPRLFDALGLLREGRFIDAGAAERAVHLLQALATGAATSPEYQLTLNKLLCGLPLGMPVCPGIELTEREADTIDSLLRAMIATWKTIGNTSVEGLRQSFLVRRGELWSRAEAWDLTVAPGPFDMLLDRLPWSFSIIKFAWMAQPVHVTWR